MKNTSRPKSVYTTVDRNPASLRSFAVSRGHRHPRFEKQSQS